MSNKNNYLMILIMIGMIGIASATDISSCTNLTTEGDTYYLTTDISDSGYPTCINITADSVTLDCQGNTIDGSDANNGIWITRESESVTIKNCIINDWQVGIKVKGNSSVIYGNNITHEVNSGTGILLKDSYHNNISNNNITGFSQTNSYAIEYDGKSSYNIIESNNLSATTDPGTNPRGIYYDETDLNGGDNIRNNHIYVFGGSGDSIDLKAGENTNVTNNLLETNDTGADCFRLHDSHNIRIINNTCMNYEVNDDYENFINFHTSNNSLITGNTVQSLAKYIFKFTSCFNNSIYNNLFNSSQGLINDDPTFENHWNISEQTGVNIHDTNNPNIGGNYWTNSSGTGFSDTCTDADTDGFCDDNYNVTSATSCSGTGCGLNVDYLALSDEYVAGTPAYNHVYMYYAHIRLKGGNNHLRYYT